MKVIWMFETGHVVQEVILRFIHWPVFGSLCPADFL